MALERKQRIISIHAMSIILDAHQRTAAMPKLDLDARGSGIERIFHQLLHHRRRTFNHLASGDLIGNTVG